MSSSDDDAVTTKHEAVARRRREDLDSIIDAALDELDADDEDDDEFLSNDDNNNDNDNNEASGGDLEHDKKNNNDDGIASPSSLPQINNSSNDDAKSSPSSGNDDLGGGAPYSLEYLAAAKREKELLAATNTTTTARRQFFGPEPPPPSSPFHLHAPTTPAGAKPFDASSSEFVSSLEDMMKQFATEMQSVSGSGGDAPKLDMTDEKTFDAMLQRMMFGMEGGGSGEQHASTAVGNKNIPPSSSTKNKKSTNSSSRTNTTSNNNNTINSNSSSNITAAPKTKKEPKNDVDESINRLLNGINQTSSPSSSSSSTNDNIPMMMGMEGIDPSQIEQFSTNIMSSIMSEFDKMGSKQDTDTVIDSVMKQLLNKELMYEPMKEVCSRFPAYLASNKDTLSNEEYIRYGKQYQYFQKICHVYETEPDNFIRLMELMQDIQEYGQPPVDIIKELAPDLQFDETGMPIMDPNNTMGAGMPMMFPGMMGGGSGGGGNMPPFPGGMGGDEQCCIS
jgi:peroxin-19